jgi:hypothetical protein
MIGGSPECGDFAKSSLTKGAFVKKPLLEMFGAWRLLLAELVVVFLGVYGAFWVDNYRDQLDREERTTEVVDVLDQDFNDFIEVGRVFND